MFTPAPRPAGPREGKTPTRQGGRRVTIPLSSARIVDHPRQAVFEIRTDSDRTAARIVRLSEYVEQEVLNSERFCCGSEGDCRASVSPDTGRVKQQRDFYEGQLHHVGSEYDLWLGGYPFRIVVVGMSYGQSGQPTLHKRSEQIRSAFRCPENPHMRGTRRIVRSLLGLPASGEDIQNKEENLLAADRFALVNYLLCSAVVSNAKGELDRADKSTAMMRRQCGRHFRKAMEILEPTVIVAQGTAWWIKTALTGEDHPRVWPLSVWRVTEPCRSLVVELSHPSARNKKGWFHPAYWERVSCAVSRVHEHLGIAPSSA